MGRLINSFRQRYITSRDALVKETISESIVRAIQGKGGQFLEFIISDQSMTNSSEGFIDGRLGGKWYAIGDSQAVSRTARELSNRNNNPNLFATATVSAFDQQSYPLSSTTSTLSSAFTSSSSSTLDDSSICSGSSNGGGSHRASATTGGVNAVRAPTRCRNNDTLSTTTTTTTVAVVRYLKQAVRKGQWTDQEDFIVIDAVTNSSEQPVWSDLAQRIPGRVGKQIRDRNLTEVEVENTNNVVTPARKKKQPLPSGGEKKEKDKSERKAPFNSSNKKRSSDDITKASKISTIEKSPAQRLVTGCRQLTPKQTTELLVVLRKISNVKNAFLGHSFVTKDTTSRALKYLLSAIRHGLMHYPDTCHPKVVQWNGVSKFCINSHIPLLIALFMALRNDDDNHKFNSEEWNKIHTEVMYGCQYAIDRKRKEKVGCNSNPLTGSTIEKTGEVDKDGKLVWKRIDARPKFHNNANIRNTSHQFTGGGTGSAYITRTVDGVSIFWPEFNDIITVQAITDLGKSLMNHLSITDHSVVGKLLEMRHWHSMNYFGHRPVGIYWFHKDGGTLSSMTNDEMESVASKGAQWIKTIAQYK